MSIYYRAFLKCKSCGFMLTTLNQASREINVCPSCEESNIDYATKANRERYAKELFEELNDMLKEDQI